MGQRCVSHGHQSSAYSRCVCSPEEIKWVLASFAWPWDKEYGLWEHFFVLTSPYRLQEVVLEARDHGLCCQGPSSKSSSSFFPPSPGCLDFSQLASCSSAHRGLPLHSDCLGKRSNTRLVVRVNSGQAIHPHSEFPRFCQCKPDS